MLTASQQPTHCFKVAQAGSAATLQHHDSDVIPVAMALWAARKARSQAPGQPSDVPADGVIGCELELVPSSMGWRGCR
jgi:hypothetical protein